MSLEFHTPALTDRDAAAAAANACHARENDVSFVNIYLLRRKYGTEIAFHDGFLLRRYRAGIRAGCYGFPVGTGDLPAALHLMQADAAAQNHPFRMTLLTQEQCRILAEIAPDAYDFAPMEGYTEYLYRRESLALLRGTKYHGKRNHIAQFWRAYPDAEIQPLIPENVQFAVEIEQKWLGAKSNPEEPSLLAERDAIEEAAANWEALGLTGLLLYADGKPVGMTAVSEISAGVCDIHFEKVAPGYPHAWSVVTNEMAKCLRGAEFLNREEDLGETGMRASKQSYHPDLLIEKYTATRKEI